MLENLMKMLFPMAEEYSKSFTYWEFFSHHYTLANLFLEPIYWFILALPLFLLLVGRKYAWFSLQLISHLVYTAWLFVAMWDFTRARAYTNLWLFVVWLCIYVASLIIAGKAIYRRSKGAS